MVTYESEKMFVGTLDGDLLFMYHDDSWTKDEKKVAIMRIHDKSAAKEMVHGFATAFQEKKGFELTSKDDGHTIFSAVVNDDKEYIWNMVWTLHNYDCDKETQIKDLDLLNIIVAMARAVIYM